MSASINAKWDTNKSPETQIIYNDLYAGLSRIERLDFLQDVISDLVDLYDKELTAFTVRGK